MLLLLPLSGEIPRLSYPLYVDEAEEVGRCLAAGQTESPLMPLEDSLAIAETLDRIRVEWGLVYPMER